MHIDPNKEENREIFWKVIEILSHILSAAIIIVFISMLFSIYNHIGSASYVSLLFDCMFVAIFGHFFVRRAYSDLNRQIRIWRYFYYLKE